MKVTRQFVDCVYGQLHLWRAGDPKGATTPLICCHMSPKSGRTYRRIMATLGENRFCMAPDYPGFGESDPPPADPHVTLEQYAECFWTAADSFGLDAVNILGYHTGSMVATAMAARHPDRVRRIIAISAPMFEPDEVTALRTTYAPVPLDEAGTRFTQGWSRVLEHLGPGADLTWAAESFAENLRAGERSGWGHRAAFNYAETYNGCVMQQQNKLVVLNPNDDLWDVTQRARVRLPEAHFHDLPEWGHGFLDVHRQAAAQILEGYLL